MKYLLLAALAAISLAPLHAAEKTISLSGSQTVNEVATRQALADSQLNFDELYKGAGSAEALTYATTMPVDFSGPNFKIVTLTGGVTFASANLVAGKTVALQITGGASIRALAFPAGWVFAGATAPTSLAANKTALLTLRSFGTTDASVIAVYTVQP